MRRRRSSSSAHKMTLSMTCRRRFRATEQGHSFELKKTNVASKLVAGQVDQVAGDLLDDGGPVRLRAALQTVKKQTSARMSL